MIKEELIKKYLENQCSVQELQELNSWIKTSEANARQIFRIETLYQLGKFHQSLHTKSIEHAEQKLWKSIAQEEKKKSKRLQIRRKWAKYAAIITLLICSDATALYFLTGRPDIEMLTATANDGKVKEIVLPDGSKAWLNAHSTLKYPAAFASDERYVYLDGEAYFEVSKNPHHPFVVQSDAMNVRVLGTKFNFKSKAKGRTAEASLIEGEIEVEGNRDEGMIILSPGQKAELNRMNNKLSVKQVNAKMDAVWHNNLIPFEKADIFTIIKTLERFYNVKIILSPNVRTDKTYSGILKRKENIESVLRSLTNTIPIRYKITGNNIFIDAADGR